jgi:hypothetical protein
MATVQLASGVAGTPEIQAIRVIPIETPSPYAEFEQSSLGEGGAAGRPNAISDALEGLCAETWSRATPDRSPSSGRQASSVSVMASTEIADKVSTLRLEPARKILSQ